MEKAEFLKDKPAPEETPYIYKYEQRNLLEKLLKNENFCDIKYEIENDEKKEKKSEEINEIN